MKVCVVIVTYANRFHLLRQVVDSLVEQQITKIIIVDNNSVEESYKRLKRLEDLFKNRLKVIYLSENTGSAGGYKRGLQEANNCEDCDFIWLLDDDNKPEKDALNMLIDAWERVKEKHKKRRIALLSLREDRKQYVMVAQGEPVEKWFGRKNSFLGFHLLALPTKIFSKTGLRRKKNGKEYMDKTAVPYAPYGGLFFNRELLQETGYPKEKFFLYGDDHEFTHRVSQKGGRIFLVPNSKIRDIDTSWHLQEKRGQVGTFLTGESYRVYYTIRNRVFFEMNSLTSNKFAYNVNKFVYLKLLWCLSRSKGKKEMYSLISRAVTDGLEGQLGRSL